MLGAIWLANIAIGIVDFAIFVLVAGIANKNYRGNGSKIMKNLLMFAVVMLIYALSSVVSSIYLSLTYSYTVAFPILIVNILSVIGFTLLYNVMRS